MELAIAILTISLIALSVGIYHLRKGKHFFNHGMIAKATVVSNIYKVRENDGGPDEGLYYPVVRFPTDKQESIKKALDTGYLHKKKRELSWRSSMIPVIQQMLSRIQRINSRPFP